MLHIAPEAFFAARFQRLDNIGYIAVDKLVPGYAYPDNVVGMDLQRLTFSNDTFDIVLCVHVLEHVMDDRRALAEIYRVLKRPGGLAIIMVPIGKNRKKTFEDSSIQDSEERAKVYGQWDHVRIYGDDFVERVVHAGFAVTVIDYVSGFSDDEVKEYGLIAENIYLCYKPAKAVNDCNFSQ